LRGICKDDAKRPSHIILSRLTAASHLSYSTCAEKKSQRSLPLAPPIRAVGRQVRRFDATDCPILRKLIDFTPSLGFAHLMAAAQKWGGCTKNRPAAATARLCSRVETRVLALVKRRERFMKERHKKAAAEEK
jgi:hypothetical protein